jgi:hypothetical protein
LSPAGTDVTAEESPKAGLVLNVIYVAGLLSFAVVLGIISEDISDGVQKVGPKGRGGQGGGACLNRKGGEPAGRCSQIKQQQQQQWKEQAGRRRGS